MSEPAETSSTSQGPQGASARYLLVIPGPEDRTGQAMAEAVREALLERQPSAEVRLARLTELLPATARGVVTRARGAFSKLVSTVRSAAGMGSGPEGDTAGDAAAPDAGLGQMADAAMATFPLSATGLSEVRRLGLGALPLLGVSSEEQPDPAWGKADLDAYAVVDEEAAGRLAGQGVERGRIAVTGIPVPRRWHQAAATRDDLRRRHNIDPTHRVVILDVEGMPLASVTTLLLQLGLMQDRVDVLFATGQDRRMADYLRDESRRLSIRARMFGEVERAEEIWALADVGVGEAGSLDLVRAAALRMPLVLLGELPVGESKAAIEALLERGAVRRAVNPLTLAAEVELLLRAERLDAARQALAPLAPREAAATVAGRLIELASHRAEVLDEARRRAEARRPEPEPTPAPEPAPAAASASPAEPAPQRPPRDASPLEDIGGPAEPPPAGAAGSGSSPHAAPHAEPQAAAASGGGSGGAHTASAGANPWAGPGRYAATNWERVVAAERAADEARRKLDTWDRRAALAREAGDMNLVRAASLEADRARDQLARALRELRQAEEGTVVQTPAASSQDEETERRFQDLNVERELEALKERMRGGGS